MSAALVGGMLAPVVNNEEQRNDILASIAGFLDTRGITSIDVYVSRSDEGGTGDDFLVFEGREEVAALLLSEFCRAVGLEIPALPDMLTRPS